MLRAGAVFGLAVVCLFGPTVAFAQQPGPPMPIAADLAKVPAGSWADYTMTMGPLPPMKMRIALVSKNATTSSRPPWKGESLRRRGRW